jgi:aminoglycoside phosphotransferase (APT) family kinase protein
MDMRQVTDKTSFGLTVAETVLAGACESANLDGSNARLIRLGENALFHLPAQSVVVRIARTMGYWEDATNEVAVSRWLAGLQFPAARVYKIAQPIDVLGHPVTFWQFIDGPDGERKDIACLGALLRRLHELPRPETFNLQNENILGRVRRRIDAASVSRTDKDFLLHRFEELEAEVSHLCYPLTPAPTHGDAHVANLIMHDGSAVLIDFERFAWGHPEWDISMTATEYLTAGWWTDDEYKSFVEAYGYDIRSWAEGFPVLRAVHEIKMTTWLMQNVNESRSIAREYENRMHTIRGEDTASWQPF